MAAEEAKKKEEQPQEEPKTKGNSKLGGLIRYILFGVIGLVAVLGIAFGTLMLVGNGSNNEKTEVQSDDSSTDKATPSIPKEESKTPEHQANAKPEHMSEEDSILASLDEDSSVMDEIMKNLEVLDYKPTSEEMASESGMSKEDSLRELSWIQKEKKDLSEREKAVSKREKELERLNIEVSKKLTRLEQAESARISQLAKLYDGMEPRSVALLIANLDDETVVSILPRMKMKNASQVLALMPAQRAAKLSKQMITIAEN